MRIAIDLDDTITHAPEFFSVLTHSIDAEIIIVSYRDNLEKAQATLRDCNIHYNKIILANDLKWGCKKKQSLKEWKAEVIRQLKVDVFFEDMPEVIALIKPPTKVFMTIDEVMQTWIKENLSRS